MIYLDNAATTAISREVVEAMLPYLTGRFGNASAVYEIGSRNRTKIEEIRCQIASMIHVDPDEIYFTSGGSESDNWAIKGLAAKRKRRLHMITDRIEHHAVLNTFAYLEKNGVSVTYLGCDREGTVSLEQLKKKLRPAETVLVSVMLGNNEIGTIEPVAEIGELVHSRSGAFFHTDAVQAFGHIPIDCREMNVDMLSASAHKLHGPKGTGFLYAAKKTGLGSFIHGGGQEMGKRAGTENIAGIVGLGKAAELAEKNLKDRAEKVAAMRDYFKNRLLREIPGTSLNGPEKNRLPNNINICFHGIEGESLLLLLDEREIYVSTGSACSAGNPESSHVLKAIGLSEEEAHSAVRFSISSQTTRAEIDKAVSAVKFCVKELRGQEEDAS